MREEYLAIWLHNKYEELSKILDWKTQKKCRVEFKNLPIQNKKVMLMLASSIISNFEIKEKERD